MHGGMLVIWLQLWRSCLPKIYSGGPVYCVPSARLEAAKIYIKCQFVPRKEKPFLLRLAGLVEARDTIIVEGFDR